MFHIKRPLNAFMIWSTEERKLISNENSNLTNVDISILLGKKWACMSDIYKMPYKKKADLLKIEHTVKYPYYKYTPKKHKKKEYIKKTYIRSKKKDNIIKETVMNKYDYDYVEPDYYNELQLFYKNCVKHNYSKENKENKESNYLYEDLDLCLYDL